MRFLRDLYLGEMIAISTQWTGASQASFASIPELSPLQSRAKDDLVALLSATGGNTASLELATLSGLAQGLDARHDHLQRALRAALLSARELALGADPPDEALAAQIDAADEALYPDGLEVITAPFEAEAGNAARMVVTADTQHAAVLGQLAVKPGMTALDLVHLLGKVGASLGDVEQKKTLTAAAAAQEAVPPAEVKRRMRAWADTVELVLGALDRSTAPAPDVTAIRQPVLDAVEKARGRKLAERAAAKKKAEEEKKAGPTGPTGPSGASGPTGPSAATGASGATGG